MSSYAQCPEISVKLVDLSEPDVSLTIDLLKPIDDPPLLPPPPDVPDELDEPTLTASILEIRAVFLGQSGSFAADSRADLTASELFLVSASEQSFKASVYLAVISFISTSSRKNMPFETNVKFISLSAFLAVKSPRNAVHFFAPAAVLFTSSVFASSVTEMLPPFSE